MDGRSTQQVDTIVIGAGQAGLSAGYHLAKRGLPFAILDADPRIGDHWRDRWDLLRLYSPARYDSLPGIASRRRRPTGRRLARWPTTSRRTPNGSIYPSGVGRASTGSTDRWRLHGVDRRGGRIAARQVIVATGPFREPHVPDFAIDLDPSIRQMHSHEYRNPGQLSPGPVLVVGLSHSGADIAFEAAKAGHRTILSGKSHGQLPIKVTDSKRAMLGWPVVEFVFGHVLTMRTPMGRRMRPEIRKGGGPLIRVRLGDLDRAGVERHDAKTVGVRDRRPVLADGTVLDVANVVWATGYRPDYPFIAAPIVGEDGWPIEVRGVSPTVQGCTSSASRSSTPSRRCSWPAPAATRATSSSMSRSRSAPATASWRHRRRRLAEREPEGGCSDD